MDKINYYLMGVNKIETDEK